MTSKLSWKSLPDGDAGTGIVLRTRSPEETHFLGFLIGSILEKGEIVALTGELGSGKTTLSQGIAEGLGVPAGYVVTSPTFTLINEYPGRIPLYHLDLYRLSGEGELGDLGYEEYLFGNGGAVIEWAEKIRNILPAESWFVRLSSVDETGREIEIVGSRDRLAVLVALLQQAL